MAKPKETTILTEGKYTIKVDPHNYILYRTTKHRTGKKKGEEYDELIGFYSNLSQSIQSMSNDMLRRRLKYNKSKTLDGMVEVLDRHMKEIDKRFGTKVLSEEANITKEK